MVTGSDLATILVVDGDVNSSIIATDIPGSNDRAIVIVISIDPDIGEVS